MQPKSPARLATLEEQGVVEGKFKPIGDVRQEEHRKRLEFWKVEVLQCALDKGWVSISARQIQQACVICLCVTWGFLLLITMFVHESSYTRPTNGNYPKSIPRVLSELLRAGSIVRRSDILSTR